MNSRGVIFDGKDTHYLEHPVDSSNATHSVIVNSPEGDKTRRNDEDTVWEATHYKHTDYRRNLTCGKRKMFCFVIYIREKKVNGFLSR